MSKLVNLDQVTIALEQAKSYVDRKVAASGSGSGSGSGSSSPDIQTGDTVKTISNDYRTVTTVYSNGDQLVKTFSDDMKTISSVLSDSSGTVITTETKTFSDDGHVITTTVVNG